MQNNKLIKYEENVFKKIFNFFKKILTRKKYEFKISNDEKIIKEEYLKKKKEFLDKYSRINKQGYDLKTENEEELERISKFQDEEKKLIDENLNDIIKKVENNNKRIKKISKN